MCGRRTGALHTSCFRLLHRHGSRCVVRFSGSQSKLAEEVQLFNALGHPRPPPAECRRTTTSNVVDDRRPRRVRRPQRWAANVGNAPTPNAQRQRPRQRSNLQNQAHQGAKSTGRVAVQARSCSATRRVARVTSHTPTRVRPSAYSETEVLEKSEPNTETAITPHTCNESSHLHTQDTSHILASLGNFALGAIHVTTPNPWHRALTKHGAITEQRDRAKRGTTEGT
jgi:hypothetical protein